MMMTDMPRSMPIPARNRIKKKILNECEMVPKYIILAAYLNDEPITGNTKLQQIMFLLSDAVKEVPLSVNIHQAQLKQRWNCQPKCVLFLGYF